MIKVQEMDATPITGPWQLPKGWEWVPLGDVCKIVIGGTPDRRNLDYWGSGHTWVSIADLNSRFISSSKEEITDLGVANSNVKEIDRDTILMSFKLTIGKLAISDKKLYTNEAIAALPIKASWSERLEMNFIFHALHVVPLSDEADLAVKGRTLNKENLARILIPIPFPKDPTRSLDIQRRIVERIEALLGDLEEAHNTLKSMRQDIDQVMGGALAEVLEELRKNCSTSETISGLISNKTIKIIGGGTPPTENERYWGNFLPWVTPKDMKRWYIDDAEDHISRLALAEKKVKVIPQGSVLVVVRGMILVRHLPVAVTTNEVTINQDMKALLCYNNLLPEYLGYMLRANAPSLLQLVEVAAHGTRRLETARLANVSIPLASENLQRRIITYLDSIQEGIGELQNILQEDEETLQQVEQGILNQGFKGEL